MTGLRCEKRTDCTSSYELTLSYENWWEIDGPFVLWQCRLTLWVIWQVQIS